MQGVPTFFATCLLLLLTDPTVAGYKYSVKYFDVAVDHFSYAKNETFRMKYLVNDTYWAKDSGPIFFYTGNEEPIETFAENTGFIWEIAPSFGALIIFAEHRYYGESLPFGNRSLSTPENAGYLTSQQALADYVDLIQYLKSNDTDSKRAVIAFGGSYGGMLAAYIRMKYPHIVDGAVAASAPIWQFTGMTECEAFSGILTHSFAVENPKCPVIIRKSWEAYRNVTSSEEGRAWLSKEWKLCKNLTLNETSSLKNWLMDIYGDLAMANYPYPSNFLADLPGHPVRAFCRNLRNDTATGKEILRQLFTGISVYFNNSGKAECLNVENEQNDVGLLAWSYQACTEMVLPICSTGVRDMFEKIPWDMKAVAEDCWKRWKVRTDPRLAEKIYGGKKIRSLSNVVFSNGLLDPWAGGGVLTSLSDTVIAVVIPEGAHHLDLRESNPADPGSVRTARTVIQKNIRTWIAQVAEQNQSEYNYNNV